MIYCMKVAWLGINYHIFLRAFAREINVVETADTVQSLCRFFIDLGHRHSFAPTHAGQHTPKPHEENT